MKNRNLDHSIHWATPPYLYAELNKHYKFLFDPCPLYHDLLLWDGLEISWKKRNYINPPYEEKLKTAFVKKAISESKLGKLCVMLLPVSTSTYLFHDHIKPNAGSIEFIKGRIPFIGTNKYGQRVNWHLNIENKTTSEMIFSEEKGKQIPLYVKNSGQHDSMIVIFGKK